MVKGLQGEETGQGAAGGKRTERGRLRRASRTLAARLLQVDCCAGIGAAPEFAVGRLAELLLQSWCHFVHWDGGSRVHGKPAPRLRLAAHAEGGGREGRRRQACARGQCQEERQPHLACRMVGEGLQQ